LGLVIFMKNYFRKNWPIFVLLIFVFLFHFLFLTSPPEAVFDEVHFGKFVNSYFTRQYYFDIHPPLGKLMIAGAADFLGYDGASAFSQIGQAVNGTDLFSLRFLPALFGVLLVWLIYKLILVLGLSKKAALFGAFLVAFDNALLVQSKFILVDIFLLVFGFFSLCFYFLSKKSSKRKLLYLLLCALFSGLAFSIKWTGLSFLGLILFFSLIDAVKQKKKPLLRFSILIFIPFLVYLLIFSIHLKILNKSGQGDAFMSPAFQKTLAGNKIEENIKPASFWRKFIELNKAMYRYNATLKASHPDASKWYQWPFMKKPIWYWSKAINEKTANIYFLGNFLIWWQVLIGLLAAPFLLLKKKIRKKISPLIYFLGLGFLINFLPFIFIGRVTFLYHYLPSLIFGILILVLVCDKVLNLFDKKTYFYSLLIFIFLSFLILSPLTYGFSFPGGLIQNYNNFFLEKFVPF